MTTNSENVVTRSDKNMRGAGDESADSKEIDFSHITTTHNGVEGWWETYFSDEGLPEDDFAWHSLGFTPSDSQMKKFPKRYRFIPAPQSKSQMKRITVERQAELKRQVEWSQQLGDGDYETQTLLDDSK